MPPNAPNVMASNFLPGHISPVFLFFFYILPLLLHESLDWHVPILMISSLLVVSNRAVPSENVISKEKYNMCSEQQPVHFSVIHPYTVDEWRVFPLGKLKDFSRAHSISLFYPICFVRWPSRRRAMEFQIAFYRRRSGGCGWRRKSVHNRWMVGRKEEKKDALWCHLNMIKSHSNRFIPEQCIYIHPMFPFWWNHSGKTMGSRL